MKRKTAIAAVTFVVAVLGGVGLVVWQTGAPLNSEQLRRRLEKALSERLDADVELRSLHVGLRPHFTITGGGLTIRHRTDPSVPLIAVREFRLTSSIASLLRNRLDNAVVVGLAITIPRRNDDSHDNGVDGGREYQPPRPHGFGKTLQSAEIGTVVADGSTLTVLPKRPEGHARIWSMHNLRLHSVRLNEPMTFESVLTNAIPPGEIATDGTFGPWNAGSPGATPIRGDFVFARADLSVFKGIAGTLSAKGRYDGTIERIEVTGETRTPDFAVTIGAHPVDLEASYEAVVDATNGNTILRHVEGTFLETSFIAEGGVIDDTPGVAGRRLTLDVTLPKARLEDVLPLAIDTPRPTMTGALTLTTKLDLPPGENEVVDRLRLQGQFTISGGQFTNQEVRSRVGSLSGRARGNPDDHSAVRSNFAGQFLLDAGRLRLSPLRFNVPGATVQIAGHYGVREGSLAFAGQVLMDASVSQAVGGWKAFLLKPFDRLFRKDGHTFIPITISGDRSQPKFGVDRRRIFNKDAPPTLPVARAEGQRPSKGKD